MMRCHYEVLGVERGADGEALRKAYRLLVLRAHPDKAMQRGEDVEAANDRFREIQAAYECLSDADERAFYDANRDAIMRGLDPNDAHDEASEEAAAGPPRKAQRNRTKKKRRDEAFEVVEDAFVFNGWRYFSRQAFADFDDSGLDEDDAAPPEYDESEVLLARSSQMVDAAVRWVARWEARRGWIGWIARLVNVALKALSTGVTGARTRKRPGFYACFDGAFRALERLERRAAAANGSPVLDDAENWPRFGRSTAPWRDVTAFYAKFEHFRSARTFTEAGPHGQAAARRAYEASIRKLAAHCKRRDPRVAAQRKHEADKALREAERSKAEAERQRLAFLEARRQWRQAGAQQNHPEEDDEEDETFICEPCGRSFTTEAAFVKHCASKQHAKRAAAALLEKLEQEEAAADSKDSKQATNEDRGAPPQAAATAASSSAAPAAVFQPAAAAAASSVQATAASSSEAAPAVDEGPAGDVAPRGDEEEEEEEEEEEKKKEAPEDDGGLRCDVCERGFRSPDALDSHLASRAHRTALKAASRRPPRR